MIYIARGKQATVHYAIGTGFMGQGMMLSGMWGGWRQPGLGYVGPPGYSPGFTYAELKPYTQRSIDRFFGQLQDWNRPQGQTALYFYDQSGKIWWSGFLF